MKIIKLNPITNGTRHQINLKKNLLSKNNKIFKTILHGHKKRSARSSLTGHITVRHKGGGCKNLYRKINFSNKIYFGIIVGIYYDPNRTGFISLVFNFFTKDFFLQYQQILF